MTTTAVLLDEVQVLDRHRRDLGDLTDLVKSIESVGLLHPIVITSDYRLVAGGRRLAAYRQLDRERIEAHVVVNLTDAKLLLEAERDENTCRREMSPSEKVSLGLALEALEKPRAEERQQDGRQRGAVVTAGRLGVNVTPSLSEGERGKVRDIVGASVGMSGVTYGRAKTVVAAATDPKLPACVREVAQRAVAEMDASGKVSTAHNKVIQAKKSAGVLAANGKPVLARPPAPPTHGPRRKHRDQIDALLNVLRGATTAFDAVVLLDESIDAEEAIRLTDGLSEQIQILRRIKNLTKERTP